MYILIYIHASTWPDLRRVCFRFISRHTTFDFRVTKRVSLVRRENGGVFMSRERERESCGCDIIHHKRGMLVSEMRIQRALIDALFVSFSFNFLFFFFIHSAAANRASPQTLYRLWWEPLNPSTYISALCRIDPTNLAGVAIERNKVVVNFREPGG